VARKHSHRAQKLQCPAYDTLFVELGVRERKPLVTFDAKLPFLRAFRTSPIFRAARSLLATRKSDVAQIPPCRRGYQPEFFFLPCRLLNRDDAEVSGQTRGADGPP
jgi:hypothetical protein